jgi:hypothetical protein
VFPGWESWVRISIASTPPKMKKTKVVTRYMIPIFLWSVVSTQSTQRLLVRGLATSWAITWGTGRRACSLSTDIALRQLAGGRLPLCCRTWRSWVTCALAAAINRC